MVNKDLQINLDEQCIRRKLQRHTETADSYCTACSLRLLTTEDNSRSL